MSPLSTALLAEPVRAASRLVESRGPWRRDAFVDVLRGYALIAITLNHFWLVAEDLGVHGIIPPTLTPFGFSSAAELFVLCSGFAWALAAGKTLAWEGWRGVCLRAARRVVLLLGAFTLLSVACATVIYLVIPPEARGNHSFAMADYALQTPALMLREILTFQWAPTYIDVLGLYVMLVGAAPVMLAGLVEWPRVTLAVSGGIYLLGTSELVPLPALGLEVWSFHPLAWQVLFVIGMAAGRGQWLARLPARRSVLVGLGAVLAACFAVKYVALRGIALGGWHLGPLARAAVPLTDKMLLGPLRLAHTLTIVAALSVAYRLAPAGLRSALGRYPGNLGRMSLPMFMLSNPVMYLAGGLLVLMPSGSAFMLLCLAMLPVLWALAWSWQRRPWAVGHAVPARSGPVEASTLALPADR